MEANNPDQKLLDLSMELPPPPAAMGIYEPFLPVGELVYVSGHGPWQPNGTFIHGRVGQDIQLEEAKQAARQTGLAILATLKANLGSLDKIGRVIKIFGMVNSTADFDKHPYVINGCSELFAQVFPVEIEAVFELK